MNNRIAAIRKELKMSQEAFSNALGLSRNFISMLENGDRIPSDRTITDICREFKVNEQWLREGEGEMFLPQNRHQQLDDFISAVQRDPDGTARKEFVEALSRMEPEFWEQWAKFMDELADIHGSK